MVSVGQSPRRLRARAAVWAQGARPAQRGRPRKSRRQRGQGPACRLPSPVSLFKAERGKDGEMEARGRGPRRGLVGRKWEPSALGRGWGEAPPLPGAGNESRPIAEPQGCLGRAGLSLVSGLPWEKPKHSGQQSAPPRQGPKQTLGAGLEASRGPQGRAGPGLPVFRQGPGVGDRGGPPPPPGEPRGTRAGKHAQHHEGSRTLTCQGTANAQSGQPGVHPGLSVPVPVSGSLSGCRSLLPSPHARVLGSRLVRSLARTPGIPALHPPSLPQTLTWGVSRAVPFRDAGPWRPR